MNEDIPYDKSFDLPPDTVEEVMPGVRRVLCNNPGPVDEPHIAALLDAVRGETVTHIIVTHTHRDHSPAAARLKAATGAPTCGEGPHRAARELNIGEASRLDAGGDR